MQVSTLSDLISMINHESSVTNHIISLVRVQGPDHNNAKGYQPLLHHVTTAKGEKKNCNFNIAGVHTLSRKIRRQLHSYNSPMEVLRILLRPPLHHRLFLHHDGTQFGSKRAKHAGRKPGSDSPGMYANQYAGISQNVATIADYVSQAP